MEYVDGVTERLVQVSSDDDSDVDVVTDHLNTNSKVLLGAKYSSGGDGSQCELNNKFNFKTNTMTHNQQPQGYQHHQTSNNNHHSHSNNNSHINNNMVPIISVTPHSPGAKHNNLLEDSINELVNIRESVQMMKNTAANQHYCSGLLYQALSASRLFSSCPSLTDLTTATSSNIWPTAQIVGLNHDRRKSWTAIEDLTLECSKNSHKSVSLSSLDSEEQESLRAERLHNRGSRNSTGGISTHSLNEAELARDFERLNAKRNLAPQIPCNRMPLQKSISTPSIAPIRNQGAKEESTAPVSRHLSDSEDDNHDDRSLLCVRDKNEASGEHREKRRKRGSFFFGRKGNKSKTKGQTSTCVGCGATTTLATEKEHADCKAKMAKNQHSSKTSSKKNSTSSHHSSSSHRDDQGRDYYDGHSHNNDYANYSDDSPLIKNEIFNEPHITLATLCDPEDFDLGVALEKEPESWYDSVNEETGKSLKNKQSNEAKRQEQIYEVIVTEKRYCQILLLIQKVFIDSLERHFSRIKVDKMFPCLGELTVLHKGFLRKLRKRQENNEIVTSIADILVEFFSGQSGQRLKHAYGEFCANNWVAGQTFKDYQNNDASFKLWHEYKKENALLQRKGIPECSLFIVQRPSKYLLLIDALISSSRDNPMEAERLREAKKLVTGILEQVDAQVAEKDMEAKRLALYHAIDAKSYVCYENGEFRKSNILERKLIFQGDATLMCNRNKSQKVMVVVFNDCLLFLQEINNNQKNCNTKYAFFAPDNHTNKSGGKSGVVWLHKLIIREKATDSNVLYLISNPNDPEMYDLTIIRPIKPDWMKAIQKAAQDCRETIESDRIRSGQRLSNAEAIDKMRELDLEQAIALRDKIDMYAKIIREPDGQSQTDLDDWKQFLMSFDSYQNLISDDCDTVEISQYVFRVVHEINQLASNLYRTATGYDLPIRAFNPLDDPRQSNAFQSPKLPTRAETFGGFDERRQKQQQQALNLARREPIASIINSTMNLNKSNNYHQEKRDSYSSETDSISLASASTPIHPSLSLSNPEQYSSADINYDALKVVHNLHTMLCIINQQMTSIASLQAELNSRDNSKTKFRHNDQLEELRNMQDKLQEDKMAWLKQKEIQEKELEEQRATLTALQRQLREKEDDIKIQRDEVHGKMQDLYQGKITMSNVALPATIIVRTDDITPQTTQGSSEGAADTSGSAAGATLSAERRKDKWRTPSISRTPTANLHSATKVNQKQQFPLKLSSSSLSSTKSEKSPTTNTVASPSISSGSGGISQIIPHKLVDKKQSQAITPNHARTGSSPAVIQQFNPTHISNPATRTNTYPKIPDKYRLSSGDGAVHQPKHQSSQMSSAQQIGRSITVFGTGNGTGTVSTPPIKTGNQSQAQTKPSQEPAQEEIYF